MGLCVNCKYHELVSNSGFEHKDGMRIFHPAGHYCNNENYLETDFVTGEVTLANCYFKNAYEECSYYEAIKTEEDAENTSEDTSGTTSEVSDTSTSDATSNETSTGTVDSDKAGYVAENETTGE